MSKPLPAIDADAIWRDLAQDAGLRASDYELKQEWIRNEPERAGLIRLFESKTGPSVVFKHIGHGISAAAFDALIDTQQAANQSMLTTRNRVPTVIARNQDARSFLMSAVNGMTLYDAIEDSQDHTRQIARAGEWVDAWHSWDIGERRAFRPAHNHRQISGVLRDIREGTRQVASQRAFVRAAEAVLDELPGFDGLETLTARQHGDLNLRNLIVQGDALYGIDITRPSISPVGYDIARLLLHYATLLADHRKMKPGHVVAPQILDAFFSSYALVGRDDPSVQVVLRVRLLNDWARLPAKLQHRSLREIFRLRRMKYIAKTAFGI